MNCSPPGLPVHHQLPEFTQTHVHRVGDAIQPSHPLSARLTLTLNPRRAISNMLKWHIPRASLVAQWQRIDLPVQELWVWPLTREDATCSRAAKPARHNCGACALGPAAATTEPTCRKHRSARAQRLCSATRGHRQEKKPEPRSESSPRLPQLQKSLSCHRDPAQPEIKEQIQALKQHGPRNTRVRIKRVTSPPYLLTFLLVY